MAKDGQEIYVHVYNQSGNKKAVKECQIGGVSTPTYSNADISIAKGIKRNASKEEVEKAFGSAIDDGNGSLIYYADYAAGPPYDRYVSFDYDSNNVIVNISLMNSGEIEEIQTGTNTQKPAYLKEYKAPAQMGKDLKSAVVKIEGELYQLPAPISEFTQNGWAVDVDYAFQEDVAAGQSTNIFLVKNGHRIDATATNFADFKTTFKNCAVSAVYVLEGEDVEVAIGPASDPVMIGTTKKDLLKLITDDFDSFDDSSTFYRYSEYEGSDGRDFNVSISLNEDTNKVKSIGFSCETWDY